MVNESTTGSFYCQSESCREIIRNIPPPPPPKLVRQNAAIYKKVTVRTRCCLCQNPVTYHSVIPTSECSNQVNNNNSNSNNSNNNNYYNTIDCSILDDY